MPFDLKQWATRWLDAKFKHDWEAIDKLRVMYTKAEENGFTRCDVDKMIHQVNVERAIK